MLRVREIRPMTAIFWLLILASVIVKLVAAQLLAWEADYVPLISRGAAWLDGGAFPAVGTLSSVAAFNLPFLVWMQLPVLVITRHIPTVLIGTQLAFNLLATVALWRLGRELYGDRAGMIAALLFTFSEVGVSSAYTAWAQLLLPGFCALFVYCLYRWQVDGRARYAALTWLAATAAFMTHFSAVLLYGVLAAWWLILRLPWNARGMAAGIGASILMLAPYMAFEAQNDFIDLRAFFTRSHRIDADTLADYAHLKPGGQVAAPSEPTPANDEAPRTPSESRSRLRRGFDYALSVPGQAISALRMSFQGELQTLKRHAPALAWLARGLQLALELCFWLGGGFALHRGWRNWRGWRHVPAQLTATADGRALLPWLVMLCIVGGLLVARATPEANASYYAGLLGLQYIVCAYGMRCLAEGRRHVAGICVALVIVLAGLNSLDRVLRVALHDDSLHTPQNMSLHRSIAAATDFIAADWDSAEVVISYDLLPELAHHWWIVPWNTVDPAYRMGMAYDYLLESAHGIRNANRDPLGIAAVADYVVTSAPGMERYDLSQYAVERFGAIFVLIPLA